MSNTRKRLHGRTAVGAAVGALLLPGLAMVASAAPEFEFTRLAGGEGEANRFGTAKEIALASYPDGASTVLLANGLNFPDALAGSYLAGLEEAPVLLTTRDELPPETQAALTALDPDEVVILGGELAVSEDQAAALSADGLTVTRRAGDAPNADRFGTAAEIATAAGPESVGEIDGERTAILASGLGFPDALAAGPLAACAGLPILLTERDSVPEPTEEALQSLGIERLLAVGGTAVIGQGAVDDVPDGIETTRLAGDDRQATAAAIAGFAQDTLATFTDTGVGLATGENFPDALAAVAALSRTGDDGCYNLLLAASATELDRPGESTNADFLTANAPSLVEGRAFGGSLVLSDELLAEAAALAGAGTPGEVIVPPTGVTATVSAVDDDGLADDVTVRFDPATNPVDAVYTVEVAEVAGDGTVGEFTPAEGAQDRPEDDSFLLPDVEDGLYQFRVRSSEPDDGDASTPEDTAVSEPSDTLTVGEGAGPGIEPNETTTEAPELVSVEKDADEPDLLVFTFDEAVPGQALQVIGEAPGREYYGFRLYQPDGLVSYPFQARIVDDQVFARFASPSEVASASRAGVSYDAVEDAQGVANVEGGFPLQPDAIPASPFDPFRPQLTDVQDFRLADTISDNTQQVLVDYVFQVEDGELLIAEDDLTTADDPFGDDFFLVGSASQQYQGQLVEEVDDSGLNEDGDGEVIVTVQFSEDLRTVPESQLRRGYVQYPVENELGFVLLSDTYEQTDGITVDPDLVTAQTMEDSTDAEYVVRYEFDEAVSDTGLDPAQFFLYDAEGATLSAEEVVRSAISGDQARVVLATFDLTNADAGTTFMPVGVFIAEGDNDGDGDNDPPVIATDNTASVNDGGARPDERDLVLPETPDDTTFLPGVTALPDLLSVDVVQNSVTENFSVTYTFDQVFITDDQDDDVLSEIAFDLYDASGTQFRSEPIFLTGDDETDGVVVDDVDGRQTVTFSIDEGFPYFDNEQLAAAVTGAVEQFVQLQEVPDDPDTAEDESGFATVQPVVTEGQRNITQG